MATSSSQKPIKVLNLIPALKGETCLYCRNTNKASSARRIYLGQALFQRIDVLGVPSFYHPLCAAIHYKESNDPFNNLDVQSLSDFQKEKVKKDLIQNGFGHLIADQK